MYANVTDQVDPNDPATREILEINLQIIILAYGTLPLIIYLAMVFGILLEKPELMMPGLIHFLLGCLAVWYCFWTLPGGSLSFKIMAILIWGSMCFFFWVTMVEYCFEIRQRRNKGEDGENIKK